MKSKTEEAYRDLLALLRDTHTVVDKVDVVAKESVPRVLRNDTEGDEESQSVTVALSSHEVKVAAGLLVFEFESQGFLDFAEFESNCGVLPVTIRMVMGENGFSLFVPLLGDEPTRGLWNPVDECELDHSRHALKQGKSSPRPTVGNCRRGPCNPGND